MEKKPLLIYVDPNSADVKEFNLSFRKVAIIGGVVAVLLAVGFFYAVQVFGEMHQNSRIARLKVENDILQSELATMTQKVESIRTNIKDLTSRDDQLRAMLDLPPINADVRQVGIGGSDPGLAERSELRELSFGTELMESLELLDRLEREVRLEKTSYQKLLTTVERREDSLRYLPVLNPVPTAYLSSSFGNRIHPILKRRQFHKGLDLATNRGTPIIAPADGYVVSAGRNGGYGNFVSINHKYGFETYYGHMNKIYVRKGQFVKRGDKIGEVGSTGLATSSHLHYEVRFKGKPQNPLDFFLNDANF